MFVSFRIAEDVFAQMDLEDSDVIKLDQIHQEVFAVKTVLYMCECGFVGLKLCTTETVQSYAVHH